MWPFFFISGHNILSNVLPERYLLINIYNAILYLTVPAALKAREKQPCYLDNLQQLIQTVR